MVAANPFADSAGIIIISCDDSKNRISSLLQPTTNRRDNGKQFDTNRYLILFKPGTYKDCPVECGFYVSMAGLGETPYDVNFEESKESIQRDSDVEVRGTLSGPYSKDSAGDATNNFYRSAENFRAINTKWAVSQACPMRRAHVDNRLDLCESYGDGDGKWASGGFIANSSVGTVNFGFENKGQQQFFSRSIQVRDETKPGQFNFVFSGCIGNGIPADNSRDGQNTVEPKLEIRVEKPFIVFDEVAKDYKLHVPVPMVNPSTVGPDFWGEDTNQIHSFTKKNVVNPVSNYTQKLQSLLNDGSEIIIAPGVFQLTASLIVKRSNQVILGLGMATLKAPADGMGSPCIRVEAKLEGIRIAGLLLEASVVRDDRYNGSCLLEFGSPNTPEDKGNPSNPGVLSDVFARVGGPTNTQNTSAHTMIKIWSGNVVGDNVWLWRADHGDGYSVTKDYECKVDTALYVGEYADNVTMYGLFCEHTLQDNVIWEGDNGVVHFYQCELNYYPTNNSCGYVVTDKVNTHKGIGLGVYCNNQRGHEWIFPCGIKIPNKPGKVVLKNPFTKCLGSGIPGIDSAVLVGGEKRGGKVPDWSARPGGGDLSYRPLNV